MNPFRLGVIAATIFVVVGTLPLKAICTDPSLTSDIGIWINQARYMSFAPASATLTDGDDGHTCFEELVEAMISIYEDNEATGQTTHYVTRDIKSGDLVYTHEAPASLGNCYSSAITAYARRLYSSAADGPICWYGPPCPDANTNGICDSQEPITIDPNECGDPCSSPIVINPTAGAYKLSDARDPVDFDINGDGAMDRITWTHRDSAIAFLALDRNRNHQIDDGTELFGTATRLNSGLRAQNGFEALREFDSNGDGLVDRRDQRWQDLLLWTDTNHDGRTQPDELENISASSVDAVETSYHWTGRKDAAGNTFRYKGRASVNGTIRSIYDVYFRVLP